MTAATLLKPDEVAEALRVSRGSVYRMVERGDLRAVKLGSGPKAHIRIPREALPTTTPKVRRDV